MSTKTSAQKSEWKDSRKRNTTNSAADRPRRPATLQNRNQRPAYDVVVAAAPRFARENALLLSSATASPVLSISIEPLKYAPSSIEIRAVVKSPTTDPSFLISIRSRARRLPFTLP